MAAEAEVGRVTLEEQIRSASPAQESPSPLLMSGNLDDVLTTSSRGMTPSDTLYNVGPEGRIQCFDDTLEPILVGFYEKDPSNPRNFPQARKWYVVFIVTMSVLSVTLTSAAYSGSANQIMMEFGVSSEVYTLGLAVYVLGFAVGPPIWAPLSELYGRRIQYWTTHAMMIAFVAGCAGANSMASLIIFRFFAGAFGASPLTNSGGFIADMFGPNERGVAMAVFSVAPFLGPLLGPVLGGFISITIGWRWVEGVLVIFIGIAWLIGAFTLPETYGPVVLQWKAKRLTKETRKKHISVLEKNNGPTTVRNVFTKALKRPWILLFREPIVLIASTYLAILYGTLYMLMSAFPIIYQENRGWNEGAGGLAFLGVAVGTLAGMAFVIFDNKRYMALGTNATPESRLPPSIIGGCMLPVSIFAFAWTNFPSIHWSVSIVLSSGFGAGMVLVFIAILNYLVDTYTIYAASAMAAAAMYRAFLGAAFPLFTNQMYHTLGVHWASSIPAFLTLACLPFPLLMSKYGAKVRLNCKYAEEAALQLAKMDGAGEGKHSVEAKT